MPEKPPIFTIGHSTRPFEEFATLLSDHAIRTLVDIRRFPGSRRHPDYSSERLSVLLAAHGVEYLHLVELGGRRRPAPDSPNTFWRSDAFRGYADHMATEEFRAGIERLVTAGGPVVVMCAEAVPWRCHRNLVADELVRRGFDVTHVLGAGSTKQHVLNPAARLAGDVLVYVDSPPQETLF